MRLNEVHLLRKKAGALNRGALALRRGPEISALCRGAVVLLSSHIEAYVKELGEHALDAIYEQRVCRSKIAPQFFYHISRDKIENVRSGSKADKIAEHMQLFVESDSGMWSNIGHFPNPISAQDFSSGFSNPKFDKIKAYLGRFGYDNFRREFYSKLGREANILAASLDQIVDARNAIAHGDPNATKTPLEIANMIEVAKYFCRTVDGLFSRWCSENMCRIR